VFEEDVSVDKMEVKLRRRELSCSLENVLCCCGYGCEKKNTPSTRADFPAVVRSSVKWYLL